MPRQTSFLSYAFRPFFFGAAAFAMLVIPAWVAAWLGVPMFAGAGFDPLWHAHEMLFGFVPAAIAGFALTAVATWTGRPPLAGPRLTVLAATWLAGRLAMAHVLPTPAWLAGSLSVGFILSAALLLGRELVAAGNRRNYPLAGLILLLAALDLLYFTTPAFWPGTGRRVAVFAALHVISLLIALIGGRIVPAFTRNWLNARGLGPAPVSRGWLEVSVFLATAVAGIAHALALAEVAGWLAVIASGLHGLRLAGWRGLAACTEPLLFVLHVAYACLCVGYGLLGLGLLGLVPTSLGLHALGIGGIGGMVLAVTTRVALGHTGRPLHAAPLTVLAYAALLGALSLRLLAALIPRSSGLLLASSAGAWSAAFLLFLVVYTPILLGPARR